MPTHGKSAGPFYQLESNPVAYIRDYSKYSQPQTPHGAEEN